MWAGPSGGCGCLCIAGRRAPLHGLGSHVWVGSLWAAGRLDSHSGLHSTVDRAGISLLSSVKWGDGTGLWGGCADVPKQGQTFSFHVGAGRSGGWGTPELSVLLCLVGRGISRSGAGPRGGLAVSTQRCLEGGECSVLGCAVWGGCESSAAPLGGGISGVAGSRTILGTRSLQGQEVRPVGRCDLGTDLRVLCPILSPQASPPGVSWVGVGAQGSGLCRGPLGLEGLAPAAGSEHRAPE